MSTVPKADTPPPANNAKTLTLQSAPGLYVRPTAGGNASGDVYAAPHEVPGPDAYTPPAPSAPANAGPSFGHGATQIVAQPDATGHPHGDTAGGGTVGDSGPQGAGPGKG